MYITNVFTLDLQTKNISTCLSILQIFIFSLYNFIWFYIMCKKYISFTLTLQQFTLTCLML
jgi:hypothetical protein